ncbi:MAG: hypothetical protein GYA17_07605 [Chloroflexi bacterium]|nr:hypothetical protein [Chloroflexota bacterium]
MSEKKTSPEFHGIVRPGRPGRLARVRRPHAHGGRMARVRMPHTRRRGAGEFAAFYRPGRRGPSLAARAQRLYRQVARTYLQPHLYTRRLDRQEPPAWKPLDMILPGSGALAAGAQPLPFSAPGTPGAPQRVQSVHSFSAGQAIPRMEDDPLAMKKSQAQPVQQSRPRKPVVPPGHRMFSRVVEVAPHAPAGRAPEPPGEAGRRDSRPAVDAPGTASAPPPAVPMPPPAAVPRPPVAQPAPPRPAATEPAAPRDDAHPRVETPVPGGPAPAPVGRPSPGALWPDVPVQSPTAPHGREEPPASPPAAATQPQPERPRPVRPGTVQRLPEATPRPATRPYRPESATPARPAPPPARMKAAAVLPPTPPLAPGRPPMPAPRPALRRMKAVRVHPAAPGEKPVPPDLPRVPTGLPSQGEERGLAIPLQAKPPQEEDALPVRLRRAHPEGGPRATQPDGAVTPEQSGARVQGDTTLHPAPARPALARQPSARPQLRPRPAPAPGTQPSPWRPLRSRRRPGIVRPAAQRPAAPRPPALAHPVRRPIRPGSQPAGDTWPAPAASGQPGERSLPLQAAPGLPAEPALPGAPQIPAVHQAARARMERRGSARVEAMRSPAPFKPASRRRPAAGQPTRAAARPRPGRAGPAPLSMPLPRRVQGALPGEGAAHPGQPAAPGIPTAPGILAGVPAPAGRPEPARPAGMPMPLAKTAPAGTVQRMAAPPPVSSPPQPTPPPLVTGAGAGADAPVQTTGPDQAGEEQDLDLDAVASQVYPLVLKKLALEKERSLGRW